jgi:hypothetical protein
MIAIVWFNFPSDGERDTPFWELRTSDCCILYRK